MGFRKPDLTSARIAIGTALVECNSPYNDGFTVYSCKEELYKLKCWLEDSYQSLPEVAGEEEWEKNRLVQLLKK
jgi:hypothetical protein